MSRRKVKEYLKERLKYSYNKGSSTSKDATSASNKIQKAIFSSIIFMAILDDKIIINVDESSFN